MGEYEPHDSRDVTQSKHRAPGEPARTGPQEAATRLQPQQQQQAGATELEQDERGEDAEATLSEADAQAEQALHEAAMEQDADELDPEAGRLDRND